jgi:hypothetical protein
MTKQPVAFRNFAKVLKTKEEKSDPPLLDMEPQFPRRPALCLPEPNSSYQN